MPKKASGNDTQSQDKGRDEKALFIIAYFLEIITGIIILFLKGGQDKRLGFHSMQSIFLGAFSVVIAILFGIFMLQYVATAINLLIWLYGMYVGLEAYGGRDIKIPIISGYAERYSGYAIKN